MATETQTPPRKTAGDATTADLRGWLTFAGVMFLVGAASNAAYGIAALADDGRFQDEQLVVGELALWGGFSLVFALAQLVTGLLLLRGRTAGVVVGAIFTMLHGTGTLMLVGAYPLWSVTILIIDGLILYGLFTYSAAEAGRSSADAARRA